MSRSDVPSLPSRQASAFLVERLATSEVSRTRRPSPTRVRVPFPKDFPSGYSYRYTVRYARTIPVTNASVSDNGNDDRSLPAARVAFQVEDLLPGPEDQPATGDGYGQRWSEQRCLQV